jgi:pimeloyl-ACP methyl ester carboxylesterase
MTEYQSIYKNDQAKAAHMAAYDRALEKLPVPYETKFVPTSYGDTHMIVSGPEDGEPIIVLHGGDSDATTMSPVIAGLAQSCRVYALDAIGFSGKSKPVKSVENRATLAEWLTEVLDALNIEKAHMAGWSMGGFLTVNYAIEKPERLKKIILIAPAATFVPFSREYHFKVALPIQVTALASAVYDARLMASYTIKGYLGAYTISKGELDEGISGTDLAELIQSFEEDTLKELEQRMDSVVMSSWELMYVPGNLDDEVLNPLIQMSVLRMKTQKPPYLKMWRMGPYALPEEDLKRLKVPTLLLIGDHEFIYEAGPDQTLKRAEELVENIQTALVPNSSHMLVYEQPELASSHMLNFLSGDK